LGLVGSLSVSISACIITRVCAIVMVKPRDTAKKHVAKGVCCATRKSATDSRKKNTTTNMKVKPS